MKRIIENQIRNTQMALSIIEATPDNRVSLTPGIWETERGTVYCPLGLIARVPFFRAQRLFILRDESYRYANSNAYMPRVLIGGESFAIHHREFRAKIAEMFGPAACFNLFSAEDQSNYDINAPRSLSSKELVMFRMMYHLAQLKNMRDLHQ